MVSTLEDEVQLGIADARAESIDVRAEGVRQLTRSVEDSSIDQGGTYSEQFVGSGRGDDYRFAVDGLVIEPGAAFSQKLLLLDGDTGVVESFRNVKIFGDFDVDVEAAAGANRIAYVDSFFENYGRANVRIAGGADADKISYRSIDGRIAPGAGTQVRIAGGPGPDSIDAAVDGLFVEKDGAYALELHIDDKDRIRLFVNPDPRSTGDITVSVVEGDDVDVIDAFPTRWDPGEFSP